MIRKVLAGLLLVVMVGIVYIMIGKNTIIGNYTQNLPSMLNNIISTPPIDIIPSKSDTPVKYKFAVIADSHEDTNIYPQIVEQIANRNDLKFVAHLGDMSNAGDINKIRQSKEILDRISVPVYVLPGDHDLNWIPNRDLTNFLSVFGMPVTTYGIPVESQYYLFIDNSDSQNGIPQEEIAWIRAALEQNAEKDLYVFMSTPLSNPYLDFKTMGAQSQKVKQQADELGELLASYGVKAILAGDTHTFSQYTDEVTGIPVVTVGAVGTNKNPLPLYIVVEILADDSYNVTSIPYYENK